MSSCTDIREELKAYADGELSGSLRGSVRQHVERCAACGRELDEIQSLSRRLRELDTAVPRPELRSRILSHIPAADIQPARRPVPWWRTPGFAFGLGSAACALLLFVVIAPHASDMDKDLATVQERLDSGAPAASPDEVSRGRRDAKANAKPPKSEIEKLVKMADSAAKDALKPVDAPVNSQSAPPAPALKEEMRSPSFAARRPTPVPGLSAPTDRFNAPEGELESVKAVDKRDEARGGAALGSVKSEVSESLKTPQPSAPAQAPGGPAGGGFGGNRAPQVAASDENAAMAKLQSGRARNLVNTAPQNSLVNAYRLETVELSVPDLEAAANGILFFAQDEGGKPLLPEKQAEPGADEMVVTLLVPADKVDAVRAKLNQFRTLSLGKEQKDVYQLGAQSRLQNERGVKGQADNRAYFGFAAPREGVSRENLRQRDISPRGNSLEDPKGNVAELDSAKQQAPAPFSTRALSYKTAAPSLRSVKKQGEELVRLVIKLRTPAKPAAAQRKGKE